MSLWRPSVSSAFVGTTAWRRGVLSWRPPRRVVAFSHQPAVERLQQQFSSTAVLSSTSASSTKSSTTNENSATNGKGDTTTKGPVFLFPEEMNILYDSKCNVCKLEIDFLERRDARVNGTHQRRLRFTDLESGAYEEADPANGGISYAKGMAAMHGVTREGRVYEGVEVFRRAYQAVGLGWLFTITTWPVISWLADRAYDVFAKYRTVVTRGKTMDRLVQEYQERRALQQQMNDASCDTGSCSVKK